MAGIGLIVNPNSRMNRKHPERVPKLAYILGDRGICEMTASPEDVYSVAENFKKLGIEILALSGGDGTNHVTLTKFIEVYGDTPLPAIGLLRGGTMNTIANGMEIRGDSYSILSRLVEKYHRKERFITSQFNLLKVENQYGFIFGNGVVTNFLAEYYATDEPSPTRAFITLSNVAMSALWGGELAMRVARPFKGEIWVNGTKLDADTFTLLAAATVPEIGLGFTPFSRCNEEPGTFHIYFFTGGAASIVNALPSLYVGKKLPQYVARDFVTGNVRIKVEKSSLFTIDGDTYKSGAEFSIVAGPRLNFIIK